MAAASSHTHKYSNVSSTPGSEPTSEPIYQNQAELRKQLQLLDKREPIYQNLPAHEKMLLKGEHSKQITTDDDDDAVSSTSTTKIKRWEFWPQESAFCEIPVPKWSDQGEK